MKTVKLGALEAAVRWMEYYGKPIKNEKEHQLMMNDHSIDPSYKADINLIRHELKRHRKP